MTGGEREKLLEKNTKELWSGSGHEEGNVTTLVVVTMSPPFHGNIQQFPFKICMLELAGKI